MFAFLKGSFVLCFYLFSEHQVHYKAAVVNDAYLTTVNDIKDKI